MNNVVGADTVCKKKAEEQESLTAKVNADVAIVLPVEVMPYAQIELQYDVISEAINNYIEHYTIDARVEKVEYNLSSPELSDKDATTNLKESLTGTTDEITTSKGTIHIENDAIKDNKVTLTFKLSVEENVYLDESDENPSDEINCRQVAKTSSQNPVPKNNVSSNVNSQRNGDLIIQSAEPKLYWQSAPKAELYWQNAPSNISKEAKSKIKISDGVKDNVIDYSNKISSGVDTAMDSVSVGRFDTASVRDYKQNLRYGNNGRVYTNPNARGNQYYKIAGTLSDSKAVSRLGTAGKVISYGTTIYRASEEYSKASTSQEKGRVGGATTGKVAVGTAVGTVASVATTAVLVTIAGAAGVATAPVTLIVIAGCSIVAGVAASSAVEGVGEEIGGNAGAWAVNKWQSLNKNK